MSIIHELCCGTVDEARVAAKVGVDRIELCAALACGGVTPSPAMLDACKEMGLEVMAMVRSREGGFCYSEDEFRTMLADARWLIEHGADGLVFGCLDQSGVVDRDQTIQLVEAAQGRVTMVHRASDVPENIYQTVETLVELGIHRVLTSGKGGHAIKGKETLADLVNHFGQHIQFVAGGGIRPDNVVELLEMSQVPAVHYAARKSIDQPGHAGVQDPTCDPEMVVQMKQVLADYQGKREQ